MKKVVIAFLFGILISSPAMAQQLLQPVPGPLADAKIFWFPYVVAGGGYEFDIVVQGHPNMDVMFRLSWYRGPADWTPEGPHLLFDAHLTDGRTMPPAANLFSTILKGRSDYIRFTSPASTPQSGFMRVEVARTVSGAAAADFSLTFRYKPNGVTVTEATVSVVEAPAPGFVVFGMNAIEQGDSVDTGLAIANPNDVPVVVDALWRDPVTGIAMVAEAMTLEARSLKAAFISQILPIPLSFRESITFRTRDGRSILATALKGSGRGKEVISTVPVKPIP